MNDEIEVFSDGDGIAVIGGSRAVERFLASEGLVSRELGLQRLGTTLSSGAGALQAGSEIAATSGRWVKLTEQSAQALKQFPAMTGSNAGVSRAVVTSNGKIKSILKFAKASPVSMLTNPAMLAGAAGLMAQIAMQQTMDEITDYLATIDQKVDDVLRAQKDAVFADMIGVDLVIEEAMIVREQVGRVSDVTWSKVQGTSLTITRTQAYALRQLDAFAEKLEKSSRVSDLVETSREAEEKVQEWLAVIARCFQLHDALAILELDRVLDTSPTELGRHRVALRTSRENRLDLISRSTMRVLARMDAAAAAANSKVLLNPLESPAVVRSSNHVASSVSDFNNRLGIENGRDSMEARRWTSAVADTRDDVVREGIEAAVRLGAEGVDAAVRIGSDTFDRAKSIAGTFADFTGRTFRRGKDKNES